MGKRAEESFLSGSAATRYTCARLGAYANTVSVGYNTDTHSFGPLGINGSFSTDFLTSVVQENVADAANREAALSKTYGDILVQMGEFTPEEIANLHTDPNGNEKIVAAFNEIKQNAIDSGNEGAFGQRLQDAINNLNQQNNTDIPVNDPLNDRSSWPQNSDEQAGKNILDLGYALTKKDDEAQAAQDSQGSWVADNSNDTMFDGAITSGLIPSPQTEKEFWDAWAKESPAATDIRLKNMADQGYDITELKKKVMDYRAGRAAAAISAAPANTDSVNQQKDSLLAGRGLTPEKVASFLKGISDNVAGFLDKITNAGGNSNVVTSDPYTKTNQRVPYQFLEEGNGFYNVASQSTFMEHKYGQKELVDTLKNTISAWQKSYPNDPIGLNDLGYKTGGGDPNANGIDIVNHHHKGNQVDIAYPVTDGGRGYKSRLEPNYDQPRSRYDLQKTIDLIKTISANMPEGLSGFIKFNDPAVREYFDKNSLPNLEIKWDTNPNRILHSNHLHLELNL
nr:TIGR04388 family protein [Leptospira inadai]